MLVKGKLLNSNFYRDALDHCGAHLCVLNSVGEIVYVNHHWKQFGIENGSVQKDWLGINYLDVCQKSIISGDRYASVVHEALQSILRNDSDGFQLEYPCHSQTERRWFLLRAVPFKCDNELLVALYHELFLGDKELKISQKRLALAIDSCSLGVWDLDLEEGTLEWNHWMYVIYGVNPEDFSPDYDNWKARLHPDDRDAADVAARISIKNHTEFESEFRITRPNGEVRSILAKAHVVSEESGKKRMIGVNIDVTDKILSEEKIKHLQFYDQLTDLPNRRLLSERIQQSISLAKRSNQFHALMMIDLDNFKRINESAGHKAGDILLKQTAERLSKITRDCDFVSRIGGDEFIIILDGLGIDEFSASKSALNICNNLHQALEQPFFIQNKFYRSTASIGVTLYNDEIRQESDLLREADLALYRAKEDGAASVGFYHSRMQDELSRRMELEHDLRQALVSNQLSLVLQPQITDGEGIIGAEVLTRWKHPQKGFIPPYEFIKVAEDCDLMLMLGDWIFVSACKLISEWQKHPKISKSKFAINISPKQLNQKSFPDYVKAILLSHNINPGKICLEITEGLLLENIEDNIAKIDELKLIGVSFSVDDFGTGYSSLAYLNRLPINQLKIDKSFVDDLLISDSAVSIAKAIIALGKGLDLNVIAEGVETEAQRDKLKSLGCNSYQGYLYSRPVDPVSYENLFSFCDATVRCDSPCIECIKQHK